jgi:predicted kinase
MPLATVHIVFGPQGAGKTTYSRQLARESNATRFSIDEWMGELFGPDLARPIDFAWVMERVQRCERRIWATASEIAARGGTVVLDLGFMKVGDRLRFASLAESTGLATQLHFVSAPHDLRRSRVVARNKTKGDTFAFEVTPAMFDFMEKHFEPPTDAERSRAIVFSST